MINSKLITYNIVSGGSGIVQMSKQSVRKHNFSQQSTVNSQQSTIILRSATGIDITHNS